MIPKLTSEPGALDTAAAIRAGEMSPLEAVDAAIARIEALDGPINAVVVRDFDRAREAARALDGEAPAPSMGSGEARPLLGVPMTIKESFNVAGLPTTWGLAEHKDFVAREDAAVVARLKRAGAIVLGKTNVPPLLSDWQANNPNYGRTRNPYDLSRSPGGSSGGSAAALAAGMVPAEYGSDIAGSIRVPAHFCGVWGHKPTWGAVDGAGHAFPGTDGHGVALGVVGPLARNGADLAALLELTLERPRAPSDKPFAECRFLVVERHPLVPTDSGVVATVATAAAAVERAGARVDRASELLPDLAAQHAAYFPMLIAAMNPHMANPRTGQPTLLTDWYGLLDAQARFRRAWARLFECYDFVLAPPFATPAFPHEDRAPAERTLTIDGEAYPAELGMAWPGVATFPELPATVLPAGESGGLPVGLQVIGARWRDRDCIATATRIGELLAG
jgi:amidase